MDIDRGSCEAPIIHSIKKINNINSSSGNIGLTNVTQPLTGVIEGNVSFAHFKKIRNKLG